MVICLKIPFLMELKRALLENLKVVTIRKTRLSLGFIIRLREYLEVSTDYGFDKNLWHNYLTYLFNYK